MTTRSRLDAVWSKSASLLFTRDCEEIRGSLEVWHGRCFRRKIEKSPSHSRKTPNHVAHSNHLDARRFPGCRLFGTRRDPSAEARESLLRLTAASYPCVERHGGNRRSRLTEDRRARPDLQDESSLTRAHEHYRFQTDSCRWAKSGLPTNGLLTRAPSESAVGTDDRWGSSACGRLPNCNWSAYRHSGEPPGPPVHPNWCVHRGRASLRSLDCRNELHDPSALGRYGPTHRQPS